VHLPDNHEEAVKVGTVAKPGGLQVWNMRRTKFMVAVHSR
jgi:hypothetical protein